MAKNCKSDSKAVGTYSILSVVAFVAVVLVSKRFKFCLMASELLSSVLILLFVFDARHMSFRSNCGETESKPRESFNISAPNKCSAVIVDGVGSGTLNICGAIMFHMYV